jgi:pentatricopeptide repeat protein
VRSGKLTEAADIYRSMRLVEITPNDITFQPCVLLLLVSDCFLSVW